MRNYDVDVLSKKANAIYLGHHRRHQCKCKPTITHSDTDTAIHTCIDTYGTCSSSAYLTMLDVALMTLQRSDEIEMLRKERIIEYNHEEHGLATLIAALLECVDTEQLHDVHKRSALPTEPPLYVIVRVDSGFKVISR